MKLLLPTALMLLLLCACTPSTIKPPAENDRKVVLDERLLQPCAELEPLTSNPQPTDVLRQHGKDVLSFKECARTKADLIKVIRKAFY